MRSRAILFSLISTLLVSAVCSAQSKEHNPLLARVSYSGKFSKICFSVYQNGEFFRQSSDGITLIDPDAVDGLRTWQGKLSEEQLTQLTALLQKIDFRPQQRSGLVFNGADWFVAEIPQDHKIKHYSWVNADEQDPFPQSVLDVVKWLENFKAQNARLLSSRAGLSSLRICPSMSMQPVQPVIAGLSDDSDATRCGGPER